ncbi:hypothetical protein DL95DRAFT_440888 [Leptodontidium sp. 2 PMI_412]|nr:hypothetical protein DL95DRAFT_440888 [Leptodontidium sp. 2 PMI_412]
MTSKPHTLKTKRPPRFKPIARLPPELQCRIWELACPGSRLIEVYPRQRCRNDFKEVVNFGWQAHRCECEHNCNSPLAISQVRQESRRVFNRVEGEHVKCFGTHINSEKDILYIGDRTGHLHNTEFLKAIDMAGGLGKVKNLAIHEDVWADTKARHGDENREFRRCGPVGVVHQLGVKQLTIVGKTSFFRDGTEFHNEVDEREWLYNSDSEVNEWEQDQRRWTRMERREVPDSEEESDEQIQHR